MDVIAPVIAVEGGGEEGGGGDGGGGDGGGGEGASASTNDRW